MTDEEWNGLSTFAQLSNIAGDVKRCVDSRQNFLAGISKKDYSEFYFNKVASLLDSLLQKEEKLVGSSRREHIPRKPEFLDELNELRRFLNQETDGEYILRYWTPFMRFSH